VNIMAGETRRYFGDRGGNGGNTGTGHPRGENGWGGEDRFTPEGKARALANLQPDRLGAVKHGLKLASQRFMACNRCPVRAECERCEAGADCAIEREYVRDRQAAVLACAHVDPVLDGPTVSILVWQELRLARAARYLAARGEVLPGAEVGLLELQPLARDVPPVGQARPVSTA